MLLSAEPDMVLETGAQVTVLNDLTVNGVVWGEISDQAGPAEF